MIIDKALEEMAAEAGEGFDPQACNLADFCKRTGLTRSKARTIKRHGFSFRALPHGNSGRRAETTVLTGHTGLVDDLLRKGVTNSPVIFEKLLGQGYEGGLTSVKVYISGHRDLVPAKRRAVAPQGSRGQRFIMSTDALSNIRSSAQSSVPSPVKNSGQPLDTALLVRIHGDRSLQIGRAHV